MWAFNQPIFTDLIPLDTSENSSILNQTRANTLKDLKTNFKHYWILHRFHHIYPEAGVNILSQNYNSIDNQELSNGNRSDFTSNGFNNDLDFSLIETYAGAQYKAKANKFIFKPGLFLHYYDWRVKQFQDNLRDTGKAVLLPQLQIDWELSSVHKVKLRYNLYSQFGEGSQFANRLRLQGFNQVFAGNPSLENELYHRLNLNYSKFSLFKGNFINVGFNYNHRVQSIRNTTVIEDINQINTLIFTSLPENSYSTNAVFTKLLDNYRLKFGVNASLSDYSRIINEQQQDFNTTNFGYEIEATTRFKKAPNVTLGWKHRFNNFKSTTSTNNFTNINPFLNIECRFFRDFVLNTDYNYTYFENKDRNEINRFSIGNASLLYNKEDSPWTIELESSNIFDTQFRNENSFSQFLVSDTRTFIQPRVILLKIGYSF